jgi:F-type H+-transporting ATPase subunit b
MKKVILLGIMTASLLLASEGGQVEYDIVQRTINFLIFVAILYYLLKDRVKEFFENRSAEIERKFQEVEERLRESKERREALKEELELAKVKAQEIVETAQKETSLIKEEILERAKREIEVMEKNFQDSKVVELNKVRKEVVEQFLRKLLEKVHLEDREAVQLLLKGKL